jgi:hypothetical protein
MLVVGLVAAATWVGFVQQIILGRPFGDNPGPDWSVWLLWLGFGIAFPLAFWTMRLIVEISPETLSIRYVPLLRRSLPLAAIRQVEARRYNPLLEYGGWGIRGWRRGRMMYSIGGNQCVEIELQDGTFLAVGSRCAEALAAAIQRLRATEP